MESVSFLISSTTSTDHHNLRHGVLGAEFPLTGDLLLVLKSNFNSLASVNTDLSEVKKLGGHAELGDSELRDELDGVGGTILNLNWHRYDVETIGVVLASRVGHVKHDGLVSKHLHGLVGLNSDLSVVEHLLVELERYGDLTDVSESEGLLALASNHDVSEVTDVGGDVDVIKVDGHATELDSTSASLIHVREAIGLAGFAHGVFGLLLRSSSSGDLVFSLVGD